MKFHNADIQKDYDRWVMRIGANDPYEKNNTIGILDVLKAHYLIADFFTTDGEGIGGIGPKNLDLLHSALYRQHLSFDGISKYTDKFEIIATLLYGLVKDHPFHDANKRTAFLSTLYFLQKLGYMPAISHEEFEDFLVEVAGDEIKLKKRYKEFVKKYEDPEVQYVAWYLRKNTRRIDRRQYIITYRQLQKILNRYNFDLKNPAGNQIGVYQYKRAKLSLIRDKWVEVKIGTIGFPSWTKQVYKGELKRVREMTKLTVEEGYDAQTFYKDADDLETLIAKYQEPLRRLAVR